jgi:hypothetical protein
VCTEVYIELAVCEVIAAELRGAARRMTYWLKCAVDKPERYNWQLYIITVKPTFNVSQTLCLTLRIGLIGLLSTNMM